MSKILEFKLSMMLSLVCITIIVVSAASSMEESLDGLRRAEEVLTNRIDRLTRGLALRGILLIVDEGDHGAELSQAQRPLEGLAEGGELIWTKLSRTCYPSSGSR